MELERDVAFCLAAADPAAAQALLERPQEALGRLAVFRDLELSGDELRGALVAPFALLGEVRFPFRARFTTRGETASLEPLDPGADDLAAELSGRARREGSQVCYRARVRLRVRLPEGEKWGGRAFKKMAEAAFARTLERTLADVNRGAHGGLLD
ncbi:DUF3809 family protein [Oceanithermus profundus]